MRNRFFKLVAILATGRMVVDASPAVAKTKLPPGELAKVCGSAWPGASSPSEACAILTYDPTTHRVGATCTLRYSFAEFDAKTECTLDENSPENPVTFVSSEGGSGIESSSSAYHEGTKGVRYGVTFRVQSSKESTQGPKLQYITRFKKLKIKK
jgi:hypothetical protein